jgi:hypothetical protein
MYWQSATTARRLLPLREAAGYLGLAQLVTLSRGVG